MTSTSRKSHSLASAITLTQTLNSRVNHKLVFSFTVWIEFTHLFDSFPIQQVGRLSSDPPDQEVQCGEENFGRSPKPISSGLCAWSRSVSRGCAECGRSVHRCSRTCFVHPGQSCFAFKITTSWSAKMNADNNNNNNNNNNKNQQQKIGSANKLQERRSLF